MTEPPAEELVELEPVPVIELPETAAYAKEFDVTVEEAARRLERIEELKNVINEIVEAEGDRVAGYSIVHEPTFGAWIYLVGDNQPTHQSRVVQRAEGDVMIELGAAHSLDELIATAGNHAQLIGSLPVDMQSRVTSTDINIFNNEFVIIIDENSEPSRAEDASAMGRLLPEPAAEAVQTALNLRSEVTIAVETGPRSELDNGAWGGQRLGLIGSYCTSAFTVFSGNTRGLTSAGHCTQLPLDEHFDSQTTAATGSSYAATLQGFVYNGLADALWYTTTAWESHRFYATETGLRATAGYESRVNMQGAWVCHYGVNSKDSCGRVTSIFSIPDYNGCANSPAAGCDNRWIRVESTSLRACGGDSGGPWFINNIAYGIHNSSTEGAGAVKDCTAAGTGVAHFTAMDHVLIKLGVQLATSNQNT